ncbi:hypothetical protein CAPTEDRAFT_206372 [Capitella teleta]|uniref:BACK domain-containing protein n=1 Tax=Capitella teleta TaxID=283909 RepID=R7VK59_CAPTE|nr:hypothetical protein CAPTEDRAFT_206372 [Capitella teleta]|eukprot:ELU17061.1 hypothetical protein CAPTEDRAFT_206372 [Capitella teleta]
MGIFSLFVIIQYTLLIGGLGSLFSRLTSETSPLLFRSTSGYLQLCPRINVEVESLQALVSNDQLKVANEDIVYHAVVAWVKADPKNRKGSFLRIAPLIRFAHCTQETLNGVVGREPLMWNPECMELLTEAQLLQNQCGNQPVPKARRIRRFQVGNQPKEYLVRVYTKCEEVHFDYAMSKKKKKEMQWNTFSFNLGAQISRNKVFLDSSGINFVSDNETRFSVNIKSKTNTTHYWTEPPLENCTFHLLNRRMYAFGGVPRMRGTSNVNSLDTENPSLWRREQPMQHSREFPYVAVLSDTAYVMGGHVEKPIIFEISQRSALRVVEKFAAGRWQECLPMPCTCENGSAVAFREKIFVVGGEERVCMSYDPSVDAWAVLCRPTCSESILTFKSGKIHPCAEPFVASYTTEWNGMILLSTTFCKDRRFNTKEELFQVYDHVHNQWNPCFDSVTQLHEGMTIMLYTTVF